MMTASERAAVLAELERRARRLERRSVQIKGPWTGTTRAVLARLGTVDRQGDVLHPGLLRNPPGDRVPVSRWNHELLNGLDAQPAGWARVFEEDGELLAEVTWDDTPAGREACGAVNTERPDWSWGLAEIETRPLTTAERAAGATRAIRRVRVSEVSPVDRGAGIATGTLGACCGACGAGAGKCCARCRGARVDAGATMLQLEATVARFDAEERAAEERRRVVLGDLEAWVRAHELPPDHPRRLALEAALRDLQIRRVAA